jgi:uncharacterized protein with FMN-binding domain
MKKVLLILGIVVVVLGLAAGVFYHLTQQELQKLVETPLPELDLRNTADGTYTGTYTAFPVSVEVKVTVTNHVLTAVDIIKHDNGQGQAGEGIVAKVIEAQSLQVDVISGATYSSKVILLAIHDALTP